jgi:hypothetical protein
VRRECDTFTVVGPLRSVPTLAYVRAVEQSGRKRGEPEAKAGEVRHSSQVRPVQQDRIPTTRVDLSELARLTAAVAPEPETPRAVWVDLSPTRVPRLLMPREQLLKIQLDRNEAFLVSLLDDVSTVAMLVDVAGMAEEQTLATLHKLRARGIIDLL